MKSNRGRKGGGGSKDLGAGLKYSSRLEVGEGSGRPGSQHPRRPGGSPDLARRGAVRGVDFAAAVGAREPPVWLGAGLWSGRHGPHRAALCLGLGTASLWPGRWPNRWNFQFGGCLAVGPLVPALLRSSHRGVGNPQGLGDAGSPRRKRGHLGSLEDYALSEHLPKELGAESQSGMIWARKGDFPGGFGI